MTWDLEGLTDLNNKLNTYVSDLQSTLSSIEGANAELKSAWNTSKATDYFSQMNDFSKNMNNGIELYNDISKQIQTKCSQLSEID